MTSPAWEQIAGQAIVAAAAEEVDGQRVVALQAGAGLLREAGGLVDEAAVLLGQQPGLRGAPAGWDA